MRFTEVITLAFAFTVSGLPHAEPQLGGLIGGLTGGGLTGGNTGSPSAGPVGNSAPRFPVPSGTTIGSAINTCGDNAQLNCCNKADTSGDSVNVASGILSGLLPDLAGGNGGIELTYRLDEDKPVTRAVAATATDELSQVQTIIDDLAEALR